MCVGVWCVYTSAGSMTDENFMVAVKLRRMDMLLDEKNEKETFPPWHYIHTNVIKILQN